MAAQVTVQEPLLLVNPLAQVVQEVVTLAQWRQLVTDEAQLGLTQALLIRLNPR